MVVVENYPQLRFERAVPESPDQSRGQKNRLSVERQRYNDAAKVFNVYIRQFPGRFFAGLAGVGPAKLFEVEAAAKDAPKVNFSENVKGGCSAARERSRPWAALGLRGDIRLVARRPR